MPEFETQPIQIGCTDSEIGELPADVNDFSVTSVAKTRVVYHDDDDNHVIVRHDDTDDAASDFEYRLTLRDADGEFVEERVIAHGGDAYRGIHDATSAIETQLWEWARFSIGDRYPIHSDIDALGEPNPHPPGERPGVPETWYYSFNHNTKKANDPNGTLSSSGTYVPYSRYKFMASNADRQWYCATLNVSFNHKPPESIDDDSDHVYGTYIYLSFTPLKPVDERINQYDTREINRECLVHHESHEALSHDDLIEMIRDGMSQLEVGAEAIGDEHRQQIIEEADRRLNEDTGEYEEQMNVTSF